MKAKKDMKKGKMKEEMPKMLNKGKKKKAMPKKKKENNDDMMY